MRVVKDLEVYRMLIGQLIYLTMTWPDINICCSKSQSIYARTKAILYGSNSKNREICEELTKGGEFCCHPLTIYN